MPFHFQYLVYLAVIIFAIVGYFVWDRRYRGAEAGAFQATGKITARRIALTDEITPQPTSAMG